MKTTIDLPEEVLRRAKIHAAENETTLKELVVRGLRLVTAEGGAQAEEERKKRMRKLLKKMVATNTEPMKLGDREECYDR